VTGQKKLHSKEFRDWYSSPSTRRIRMIKSRRMISAGNVSRIGVKRNSLGYLWESERERDHKEVTRQGLAVMNSVMNCRVP
jgi:hypothetical protein